MREIISAVYDAVEKDCLIPALALTLTIPDIMGKVLYPDLRHKNKNGESGNRNIGAQYSTWYDKWVADKYRVPWSIPDESKPDSVGDNGEIVGIDSSKWPVTFTGKMCYDLRCSLLHSGERKVYFKGPVESKDFCNIYKLELRLHACNSYEQVWPYHGGETVKGNKETRLIGIHIDVGTLCTRICEGADLCLKKCGRNESDFPVLDIFDLGAWVKR